MKKSIIMFIGFATVLTLVGCKSTPTETPKPQKYTQVPLYMAGQEIPGDSQEKYLTNASVKMYSVGRLVDPSSGTMREAGTIYRIETAPQWNLIPQYDANPESFAKNQLQMQYADSVVGQMNRSLSETQEVKHQMEIISQEVAHVDNNHKLLVDENSTLKKELKKQNDNTANLLKGIQKMQKYIELLEQKINDRNTMNLGGNRP